MLFRSAVPVRRSCCVAGAGAFSLIDLSSPLSLRPLAIHQPSSLLSCGNTRARKSAVRAIVMGGGIGGHPVRKTASSGAVAGAQNTDGRLGVAQPANKEAEFYWSKRICVKPGFQPVPVSSAIASPPANPGNAANSPPAAAGSSSSAALRRRSP